MTHPSVDLTPGTPCLSNPCRIEQQARADIKARRKVDALRRAVNVWQPIETAPRDGTIIDVWLGTASKDDLDFYCGRDTKRAPSWQWWDGKFRPAAGLKMPTFIQPTHWMPLPAAPSDSTTAPQLTDEEMAGNGRGLR